MDSDKRKRVPDEETAAAAASGRKGKVAAVKAEVPADEEVEEFFAILRRIQVAVKYFQEREGGGRELAATPPWSPSFEREDFDGVKKPEITRHSGLDLNSDPAISDDQSPRGYFSGSEKSNT